MEDDMKDDREGRSGFKACAPGWALAARGPRPGSLALAAGIAGRVAGRLIGEIRVFSTGEVAYRYRYRDRAQRTECRAPSTVVEAGIWVVRDERVGLGPAWWVETRQASDDVASCRDRRCGIRVIYAYLLWLCTMYKRDAGAVGKRPRLLSVAGREERKATPSPQTMDHGRQTTDDRRQTLAGRSPNATSGAAYLSLMTGFVNGTDLT